MLDHERRDGARRCGQASREAAGRRGTPKSRDAVPANYDTADINEKLFILLHNIAHMMRAVSEGKASQRRILMILRDTQTITQRDLTERLGIQPGSASEILLKLEHAGLIRRTPNECDRRTTDVRLTEAGAALAEEAQRQRHARYDELVSCFSETEKQELLTLLEKLRANWSDRLRKAPGSEHRHGASKPGRQHWPDEETVR